MDKSVLSLDTEMMDRSPTLWQLFSTYFRIGILGFGPALLVETKKRVIQENHWIREEDLLDGLALSQLLPGATYVSLTTYIGYKIRGISGAATCAFAFLLPPFFIMVLLSHLYFSFGSLPQISLFFKGLSVVVAALVLHAVIEIGKSAIFDFKSVIIAVAAAIIIFLYSNIFMLLLFAISAGIVLYSKSLRIADNVPDLTVSQSEEKGFQLISVLTMFSLLGLFFYIESFHSDLFALSWVFFRMGTLLFGGGMSMLPFIEQEVVRNYHWLTQEQFIVGIALGQATPGPILITATFVGYKVEGLRGAIASTAGMFAPSLILVTMMAEIHQKIRKNLWVKSAVKGLVASFNGLIAVFAVKLACYSLTDSISVFIALTSFFLLRSDKLATGWIILFGSAVYWLICTAVYSN